MCDRGVRRNCSVVGSAGGRLFFFRKDYDMIRWLMAALALAFVIGTPAAAVDPCEIKIVVTTQDDLEGIGSNDDYTIVVCDGTSSILYIWAICSDPIGWPNGVNVGEWIFSSYLPGQGDDITFSGWKVAPAWKVGDCVWAEDDENQAIAWTCDESVPADGLFLPSDEYTLLGYATVVAAEGCDRTNETHSNILGWMTDFPGDFLPVDIGPEEVTRELTPDCDVAPTIISCPFNRAFCVDNQDCAAEHPDRDLACGECGTNLDCDWPEKCCCGVCEEYDCCFDGDCTGDDVCVDTECVECGEDGDCESPLPCCVAEVCVECEDNSDCSYGYVCIGGVCELEES